jgi:hypothetical protein
VPVDVLAIAAHPDDVELTCGGTLASLKAKGYRFGIVDLTRGEMGTRGTPEVRAVEAKRAAEILGAEFRDTLDLGDGGLRRTRKELAVIDVSGARNRGWFTFTRRPAPTIAGRQIVTDAANTPDAEAGDRHPAHRPQQTPLLLDLRAPRFLVDDAVIEPPRGHAGLRSQFHDPASKEPQTILAEAFRWSRRGRHSAR